MRWDRLFADLEAQWDTLAWQQTVAEAAELTRAEWAGVRTADRLRGARGADLRVHLTWGETLPLRVRAVGESWLGGHLAGGGSAIVVLDCVAALEGELGAAVPAPAGPGRERGLAAVLRGLARARAAVAVTGRHGGALGEGTIDRVGADHLDVARHARDEARRAAAVRGVLVVPFAGVGLVRTPGSLD